MERIRMRDIAESLGLSTATVSNVIHGKTQRVSDETIKRVQEALEEHHYIPSMAGILLAQNASRIIGVFLNDHEKYEGHTLEDAFIASSLNHLSAKIEESGQFMMVKQAKNSEEIIKFASMWNMDGVIIIGFCHQDYLYLRSHMRIPFVVYDGFCQKAERFVNITIDDFDGGCQMGTYFRSLGHKAVLCLSDNDTGVDHQRIQGFREGFGGGELLLVPMHNEQRQAFFEQALPQLQKVTAVFAVSDFYAVDLIRFLNRKGLRVPQDISVAGFDDIPLCQLLFPPLTTVRQDGALRASIALDSLKRLAAGEPVDTHITLPVTLVKRESVRALTPEDGEAL